MSDFNTRPVRRAFWRWFGWHLAERFAFGFGWGCAVAAVIGLVALLVVGQWVLVPVVFGGFLGASAAAWRGAHDAKQEVEWRRDEYERMRAVLEHRSAPS